MATVTNRKELLRRLIVEKLAADLANALKAAKNAHQAAIDEENIPDNKYDTLSLEASYLAQGQANRAQELKAALQAYQNLELQQFSAHGTIRLTALISLEGEDGSSRCIFLGPEEGGLKVHLDQEEIVVITPSSPLGADLLGKEVGDEVTIGGGKKSFEIVEIS